jgi:hypothetical protein
VCVGNLDSGIDCFGPDDDGPPRRAHQRRRTLESIGKLKALSVDKTGTITERHPRVMRVAPFNSIDETEIVRIAAAIARILIIR